MKLVEKEHELCDNIECQQCCNHDEFDHGICLYCGLDISADLAARMYDRYKDMMKYGE